MSSSKPRVLVLHSLYRASRKTIRHHLSCFARYVPEVDVVYHHFRAPITPALKRGSFDLIILNACVLSNRVTKAFRTILHEYSFLPESGCPIVAIPFDDWMATAHLDEWLYRWDVQTIYTPRDYGQDQIYVQSQHKARLEQVMTGFIDEQLLETTATRPTPSNERTIDLGTRVRNLPYRCGWFGRIKGDQAMRMRELATNAGLVADISTRLEDTFVGTSWFDFLGSCRFTVAHRGGSSLLDPYGEIKKKIERFLVKHPDAPFEEVEAACFPGLDSPTPFTAVTPRILDAALMRTGLILGEGQYLDLQPWVHYLPLKSDLSNADEVFDAMRDDSLLKSLTDNAWAELVGSGKYTYRAFAQRVIHDNLPKPSQSQKEKEGEGENLKDHIELTQSLEEGRAQMGPELFELFRRALLRTEAQQGLSQLRHGLTLSPEDPALDPEQAGSTVKLSKLTRAERESLRWILRRNAGDGASRWLDALEDGLLNPFGRLPWLSLDPFDDAQIAAEPALSASTEASAVESAFLEALGAEISWQSEKPRALPRYREAATLASRHNDIAGWFRACWLEALLADELRQPDLAFAALDRLVQMPNVGTPSLRARTANVALALGVRERPETALRLDTQLDDAFAEKNELELYLRGTNVCHLLKFGLPARSRARKRARVLLKPDRSATTDDSGWLLELVGSTLPKGHRARVSDLLEPLIAKGGLRTLGNHALLHALKSAKVSDDLRASIRKELTSRLERVIDGRLPNAAHDLVQKQTLHELLELVGPLGADADSRLRKVIPRLRREFGTTSETSTLERDVVWMATRLLSIGFVSDAELLIRAAGETSVSTQRAERTRLMFELCQLQAREAAADDFKGLVAAFSELEGRGVTKLGTSDSLVATIRTRGEHLEWRSRPRWRRGAGATRRFLADFQAVRGSGRRTPAG